jgi:hypothetical protein
MKGDHVAVLARDKRDAFARRSCSIKKHYLAAMRGGAFASATAIAEISGFMK